jgi:chitinase
MGRFNPEDIDPILCTHVVYAFATLKDHLLTEGSDKDAEMYHRLIALRESKNPDIKVSIRTRVQCWIFFKLYIACQSNH